MNRHMLAAAFAVLVATAAQAQTYPSPTFQNLTVLGTQTGGGGGGTVQRITAVPYATTLINNGVTVAIVTGGGAFTLKMPAVPTGQTLTVLPAGVAGASPAVTFLPNAGQTVSVSTPLDLGGGITWIWDAATAAWVAQVANQPTLDVDFVARTAKTGPPGRARSVPLASLLTNTRAGPATYIDATGAMRLAADNSLRFTYNPATLAPFGLRTEEQRTNITLLGYSGTNFTSTVSSAATLTAVTAGGSGYLADDVVSGTGGTCTKQPSWGPISSFGGGGSLTFTSLSNTLISPGVCSIYPTSPITLTGGSGTGATVTLTTSSSGWVTGTNGQGSKSTAIPPLLAGSQVFQHTLIAGSADNNTGGFRSFGTQSGRPWTSSAWVYVPSASSATAVSLTVAGTGVTTTGTYGADLSIRDKWQRVATTFTGTAGNWQVIVSMTVAGPSGALSYSSNWQTEAGGQESSYIPSDTTALTRAADAITFAPGAMQFLDPSAAGTLIWGAQVGRFGSSVTEAGGITLSDGTASNTVSLRAQGDATQPFAQSSVVSAGVSQAALVSGNLVGTAPFQLSLAFNLNDFESYLHQGAAVDAGATDTSGVLPYDLSTLAFDGSGVINHQALRYYPARVSPLTAGVVPAQSALSANTASPGFTIPADFVGVSFETGSNGLTGGVFTASNTSLISLLRTLGTSGTLRIGGNTSDTTVASAITSGMVSNLRAFLTALGAGWRLQFGLNSKNGDTAGATTLVGLIEAQFGSGVVEYQIGNEPDLNATFADEAAYLTAWNSYYTAIHAAYPAAVFIGPDIANSVTSGSGWIAAFMANVTTKIAGVTQHYYTGLPGSWTPATLLGSSSTQLASVASVSKAIAGALPIRMAEMNDIAVGGQTGVSNRAVSAAWMVDSGISLAKNGWVGFNVHGSGSGTFYSPFAQSGSTWTPTPKFAGLLLISKIAGQQILPVTVTGNASINALATVGADTHVRFLLVNTDATLEARINLTQTGAFTTQSVLMETAASPTATSVTLGGSQVLAGGVWSGVANTLPRGTPILLPPASAALVTLQ